jgi:hypothetical protein
MAQRLSDAEIAAIRYARKQGCSVAEIAAEYAVPPQYVRRVLKGSARPQIGGLDAGAVATATIQAVDRFLAGLELCPADAVLAETARGLAEKLDAVRASDSATAAAAAPSIARQLVDVVAALRGIWTEPSPLEDILRRRDATLLAMERKTALR